MSRPSAPPEPARAAPGRGPPPSADARAVLAALPGHQPVLPSIVDDAGLAFPCAAYADDTFDYVGAFVVRALALPGAAASTRTTPLAIDRSRAPSPRRRSS